jgi:hypothetical protein
MLNSYASNPTKKRVLMLYNTLRSVSIAGTFTGFVLVATIFWEPLVLTMLGASIMIVCFLMLWLTEAYFSYFIRKDIYHNLASHISATNQQDNNDIKNMLALICGLSDLYMEYNANDFKNVFNRNVIANIGITNDNFIVLPLNNHNKLIDTLASHIVKNIRYLPFRTKTLNSTPLDTPFRQEIIPHIQFFSSIYRACVFIDGLKAAVDNLDTTIQVIEADYAMPTTIM